MAKQKYIRTEYNDGNVVLSNIRKGRASIPVIGLNDSYTATKVNTWFDGSPMTPEKADGSVYLRLAETGEYFRVNLPNDDELFLEKDTVAQLRDMSAVEILLLKMGYYKGVTLNGYYKANDTPAPIQYYLSDTEEEDDGGSVFEVGGIKLEHEFKDVVDTRYYGIVSGSDISDVFQLVSDKGLNIEQNTDCLISKSISLKTGISSTNNSTIKAVSDGNFSNGIAITYNGKFSYIRSLNFDLGATSALDNAVDGMISMTGDCHNNIIENLNFVNFGRHVASSSTPPLTLVSKDEPDDYSYGLIGSVRNNNFNNISFIQFQNTRVSFCIRVLTNWTKERTIQQTLNKTSDNIFTNIRISGSFLWNAIELAGTGTIRNIVKDSYIDCDAITALDIDKGASYNIFDSNTVNCGLASWASEVETSSYIFSAIQDHGSNYTLINYANKLINNKVFIKTYNVLNANENGIGVQYTENSQIFNNYIEALDSNINGITILGETHNIIISGNTIKANRAGISFNASRSEVSNVQISNNNLLSRINCIILNPTVNTENLNVRIYDNILKSEQSATGLIVINNISNVLLGYNYIQGSVEKITIGGDSSNIHIVGNTFVGDSPVMLRINRPSTIYNNTNLAASSALAGTEVSTSNVFLNSWQSTSPTVAGLLRQSASVGDITTPDATDEQTTMDLVNELKEKINELLSSDRASGQRAT